MTVFTIRIFVILILVLINGGWLYADSPKALRVNRVAENIIIDGLIEPLWNDADSVSNFVQFMPYHDQEPSKKTMAKLLTNDRALYCLICCWEEKKFIQQNTGNLDDFGGDVVSLMLDTFSDRRTAYKFAVSASGVRADCRLLDDARNRDYSWDGVWFSAAKLYDWGFVVEMEIPYRSIHYNERLAEWGLDFDRWIPSRNEDIYWCRYEENEGQRISKFGRLIFDDFQPAVKGLNLEIFPVSLARLEYLHDSTYKLCPNAGIDIFYNPSRRLTFQLTANPDFAQIEADPFSFNISRYESYFQERRPFFTAGNEVFMPSGRERNSGFYRPLELFYSRRIGKKLSDGTDVPLVLGTKAFGRIGEWEYGGFLAFTGETKYLQDNVRTEEPQAAYSSARIKKQIFKNSSIGLLFVGKNNKREHTGVLDVDGAFRSSDWQLSYQIARSYKNEQGDYAASAGLMMPKEKMVLGVHGFYVGKDFDISEVGYVPWKGTAELTLIGGPRWYFKEGSVRQILLYMGGFLYYERVDSFADRAAILGFNMQFRDNWGYEISFTPGRAKDKQKEFTSYEMNFSSWFNISPKWNANVNGTFSKTYNFSRDYLAYYTYTMSQFSWRPLDILSIGASLSAFIEWNPENRVEDITYNARPYFSLTPINNFNLRVYVDNVLLRSTGKIEQMIGGFLFSYNFRPKSWIYFAINEVRDRYAQFDDSRALLPNRLHTTHRVSVLKLKYLFYF